MSASYLPAFTFHNQSFTSSDLGMKSTIRNENVVARLNKRVFGKGCAYVVFGVDFCSIRTGYAAADINVASSDFRAVDRTFNINITRRRDFEALLHIAFYLDCAVEFNIARLNTNAAFYFQARVDTYTSSLVDNLTVDSGNQSVFADDFSIFSFGHGARSAVLRGDRFTQNIFARRAFRLRNAYCQRLIFFGEHEQI